MRVPTWRIRAAGLAFVIAAWWYVPWLVANVSSNAAWIALPFAAANLLIAAAMLLAVVNNWHRRVPVRQLVARGEEPRVAVIIPTCHEPPAMVDRTARSVLKQDWPRHRFVLVISDDGHSPAVAELTRRLRLRYQGAIVLYHEPPLRGAPERRGEAKAGNLNSALERLDREVGRVALVETRDADDEVGDPLFLRECVGQLLADERIAFVQTIKEVRSSEGDPFNNNEVDFYRGTMHAKHAANAVFSCGSGVVWRRDALDDIGAFPSWNLVEDLQSGVEALRRGWRSAYVPIVGALAQYAPEDVPNVYKQRGTWALDTVRLMLWGKLRGLSVRQRMHFWETALSYLQSFAWPVFIVASTAWFVGGVSPVESDPLVHALRFLPYGAAIELVLAALIYPHPYRTLWRARQVRVGLLPVFIKASLKALLGGPRRKPVYKVTRKFGRYAWYWRETVTQVAFLAVVLGSVATHVVRSPLNGSDVVSAYWSILVVLFLATFVRRSWFGVDLLRPLRAAARWLRVVLNPTRLWRRRYACALALVVLLGLTAGGLTIGQARGHEGEHSRQPMTQSIIDAQWGQIENSLQGELSGSSRD
jgi:cellulose synthase (UDP-forming)